MYFSLYVFIGEFFARALTNATMTSLAQKNIRKGVSNRQFNIEHVHFIRRKVSFALDCLRERQWGRRIEWVRLIGMNGRAVWLSGYKLQIEYLKELTYNFPQLWNPW